MGWILQELSREQAIRALELIECRAPLRVAVALALGLSARELDSLKPGERVAVLVRRIKEARPWWR